MPPSRFLTNVAHSLILLSAGLLFALALGAVLAWDEVATPQVITNAPWAAQVLFSHPQALLLSQAVLWLGTFVSAVGLLRRWNWARLTTTGILAFQVLYGTVVAFAFPAMIPPFFPSVARWTLWLGSFGILVLFGWTALRLSSATVRAEFHVAGRAA